MANYTSWLRATLRYLVLLVAAFIVLLAAPLPAQTQTITGARQVSSTTNSISMAWDAFSGANNYEIVQTIPRLRDPVNVGNATTGTISGLQPATQYGFLVNARANNARIGGSLTIIGLTKPNVPRNLRTFCIGGTVIDLQWDAPVEGTGSLSRPNILYEAQVGAGNWQARNAGRARRFQNLSVNTTYTLRIRAVAQTGLNESIGAAASIDVTTAATDVGIPSNLQIAEATHNSLKLTWTASSGTVSSYEVSTDGDNWVDSGNDTEHVFSALNLLTTYRLRVRAKNGNDVSCVASISASTPDLPPNLIAGTEQAIANATGTKAGQLATGTKQAELATGTKAGELATGTKQAELATGTKVSADATQAAVNATGTKQGELATGTKQGELATGTKQGELATGTKQGELATGTKVSADNTQAAVAATQAAVNATGTKQGELATGTKQGELATGTKQGELATGTKQSELATGTKQGELATGTKQGELATGTQLARIATQDAANESNANKTATQLAVLATGTKLSELATGTKQGELATGTKQSELATGTKQGALATGTKQSELATGTKQGELATGTKQGELATGTKAGELATGTQLARIATQDAANVSNANKTATQLAALATGTKLAELATGTKAGQLATGTKAALNATGTKAAVNATGTKQAELDSGSTQDNNPPVVLAPPDPPPGLRVSDTQEDSVTVNWQASSGADSYEVQGWQDPDQPRSQALSPLYPSWKNIGKDRSYTFSSLSPGEQYSVGVRAVNSIGSSPEVMAAVRTESEDSGEARDGSGAGAADDGDGDSDEGSGGELPIARTLDDLLPDIVVRNWLLGAQGQRLAEAWRTGAPELSRGFVDAVDLWGYITPGIEVCFRRSGTSIIFIDTAKIPRSQTALSVYIDSQGMVCGIINSPGIVVLMADGTGAPPTASPAPATGGESTKLLNDCIVTTQVWLNFRASPSGDVLYTLAPAVSLTAEEYRDGWYQVDFYGEKGWLSADYVTPEGAC